jgi:hypothetical protein
MRLLMENWREYLKEESEEDLKQDLIAFIKKHNLDETDIEKIAAINEEIVSDELKQDLERLTNQYGQRVVMGGLATMMSMGALGGAQQHMGTDTPMGSINPIVNTAAAGSLAGAFTMPGISDLMKSGITRKDMMLGLKLASNPTLVSNAQKLISEIYMNGSSHKAAAIANEMIEQLGGNEEAIELINQLINAGPAIKSLIRTHGESGWNDKVKQNAEDTYKYYYELGYDITRAEAEVIGRAETADDLDLTMISNLKAIIKYTTGDAETAQKLENFAYEVAGEMGRGTSYEELKAWRDNLDAERNAATEAFKKRMGGQLTRDRTLPGS